MGKIFYVMGKSASGKDTIYKKLLASGKEKYAFEIIQLAREISEEAE